MFSLDTVFFGLSMGMLLGAFAFTSSPMTTVGGT
ncbi:hypothetical protein QF002_001233 [Paraburkholderia youngii]